MIGYRTQLLPRMQYKPGGRAVSRPNHLILLDMIIAAAQIGARCPSNETISARLDLANAKTAPNIIFNRLEEDGLIVIFRSPSWRGVYIVDLGIYTAKPKVGKIAKAWEQWCKEISK